MLFVQEVHNINTSGGIPYPFNNTIDSAAYMGFEKLSDNGRILADYIKVVTSQCAVSERVWYNGVLPVFLLQSKHYAL